MPQLLFTPAMMTPLSPTVVQKVHKLPCTFGSYSHLDVFPLTVVIQASFIHALWIAWAKPHI